MSDHPIEHVPPKKAHEWMRAEFAALDAARQAREDNLMTVIIQTSSAAVLAIPGFFLASETPVPAFAEAWPIYLGTAAFGLAFACACIEQIFSGRAYRAQRIVVQNYYTKKSEKTADEATVRRADVARNVALAIFAIAVSLGALGLAQFARGVDVKTPSPPARTAIAPRTDGPSAVPAITSNRANDTVPAQSPPRSEPDTPAEPKANAKPEAVRATNGPSTSVRTSAQIQSRADSTAATPAEKRKVN